MNVRRMTVLLLASLGAACGGGEKGVVDHYFGAVKAKDNQTLSSFAAVVYDKPVDSWAITATTPEQKVPAELPKLAEAVRTKEAEIAANKKAAQTWNLDHYADLEKVKEAEKAGKPVPANLTSVQAQYKEFSDKDHSGKKELAAAKDALEKEKRSVRLSVGELDDVESLQGELLSKDVDVNLTAQGQTTPYQMNIRKYELVRDNGQKVRGRWMVYSLKPKA